MRYKVRPIMNDLSHFLYYGVAILCAKVIDNHILTHDLKLKIIYFKQKRFFIKNVEIKN